MCVTTVQYGGGTEEKGRSEHAAAATVSMALTYMIMCDIKINIYK